MKYGIVLLFAVVAASVCAQTNLPLPTPDLLEVQPLPGAATNEPAAVKPPDEILIKSDRAEIYYKTNTIVYRDNVAVDDPQMKLRCDVLTLEAPKMPAGKFNRAIAEGNVVVDFLNDGGTNHVVAGKVVYTYSITNSVTNAVIVVSGNPVITTPNGHYESDPIIWDRIAGTVQLPNRVNMRVQLSNTNSAGLFAPGPGDQPTKNPVK